MSKPFLMSANVADAVVRGEPLLRVYQSRVLGPHLVHALSGTMNLGRACFHVSPFQNPSTLRSSFSLWVPGGAAAGDAAGRARPAAATERTRRRGGSGSRSGP
jgi:hypothetical protein